MQEQRKHFILCQVLTLTGQLAVRLTAKRKPKLLALWEKLNNLMTRPFSAFCRLGFLFVLIAASTLHADEPKWEAAKIKNSPLSFGKLTDTGSITVEGKFTWEKAAIALLLCFG